MASAKRKGKGKIRIKKRCCDSKRMCAGCPLRPENGGPGRSKRRKP